MNDTREALEKNSILECGDKRKVVIADAIGRGANCIVYDAACIDAIGEHHKVRVKECYPNYLPLQRKENGELAAYGEDEVKFRTVKNDFVETYKRNIVIRNTLSLTNSTIDAIDIFEANHTKYIVMTMNEGMDYREYADASLRELILHVKSLALLIQKYHKNGYLHLDIKPENILILPETKEHVLLFDFDSVITQKDLVEQGQYRLSFSEGFSAPEQMQGKINKIGPCSDIYSIGALFYYKLFGKKPDENACRVSSKYDFRKMKYSSSLYRVKLYWKLEEFFKKTLSISTAARLSEMGKVIEMLDELERLADIEKTYVVDSFQYNSSCFIGRQDEIEQIAEILEDNQVVFLSGIGGIGKTEIAKYYANKYRKQYDSVTFGIYDHSLADFVCNEIVVNKMVHEEGENDAAYFKRKIEALKCIFTEKDLVIVDNFDVEMDENLETVLSCPCKFIFTTRKDYRDCNFKQINVGKIAEKEEILELFYTYNEKEYDSEEQNAVEDLIEFVEHHTMMVELIAKYLNHTDESPSCLLARFYEKEGVTNTSSINVRQRKDRRILSESVNRHLAVLFDVFGFDDGEKEIMRSLSLLAGIRIKKELFYKLCGVQNVEGKVEKLIKSGWIQQEDKISLHQIIQDLIYTKLKPDADNCKAIVDGMYFYVTEEKQNYAERHVKNQVFDVFMHRLNGTDIGYAKLCLEYGKKERLDEAENICKKIATKDAYDMLQRICRKKIQIECACEDMYDSELDLEAYCTQQVIKIANLLELAIEYCKLAYEDVEHRILEFVSLADEVDQAFGIGDTLSMLINDKNEELDLVFRQIEGLYDWCGHHLDETEISLKKKEELYRLIQKFYSDEDMFVMMYRNEHYRNIEKAYFYQKKLNEIRKQEEIDSYDLAITDENGTQKIWTYDISNYNMAENFREKGEFEKALEYYKNSFEDENYDTVLYSMAKTYLEMGKTEDAINSLKRVLDIDKAAENDSDSYFYYTCYVCLELIGILFEQKNFSEAKMYAKELIHYRKKAIEDEDNAYAVTNVLAANYYLYKMETDLEEKEKLWNQCLELFEKLGQNQIDGELFDFLFEYLEKEKIEYSEILKILERINPWKTENIREKILLGSIKKYKEEPFFSKYHILILLKLAEMKNEYPYTSIKEGEKWCEEAQKLYDHWKMEDGYIQSMIYKITSDLMDNDSAFEYDQVKLVRQKCNYRAIAKEESKDRNAEEKIKLWEDAARNYQNIEDYKNEWECLEETANIILPILDQYDYSKFDTALYNIMDKQITASRSMGDFETASHTLKELYGFLIHYVTDKKEDRHDFVWKLNWMAWDYKGMKQYNQAVAYYMIELYVLCADKINKSILRFFAKKEEKRKLICDVIEKKIDYIDEGDINRIIDIKDGILECADENTYETWPMLPTIIDKITKTYQTKEIEFKKNDKL